MLPKHVPPLSPKRVPSLLVIIHDCLIETVLQLFQDHASHLGCGFRIMHAVAGIGQAALKALGHPPKEGFDGSFRGWRVRGGLLRNDTKSIHQDLPRPFRRKDFPPIMKDDDWFAVTGPG